MKKPKTNKKKALKNKFSKEFSTDNSKEFLFNKLAEASFDGVVIHENGIVLEANARYKKLFNYKKSPVGRTINELLTPEAKIIVSEKIKEHNEKPYETILLKRDGTTFYAELLAREIIYKGKPARITAIRDISAAKNYETELKKSEEQYKLLFKSNPMPMYVYSRKTHKILQVNNAAIKHYGYSEKEFLSKTIKDIRPKEDVKKLITHEKENNKPASTVRHHGQWRHLKKDGSIIDVEIATTTVLINGESCDLTTINDVTEKTRAKNLLIQSEQKLFFEKDKLKHYLDVSGVILIAFDVNQNVILVNKKGCEILGYKEEYILGKNWYDYFVPKAERTLRKNYFLKHIVSGKKMVQGENLIRTKNGKTRLISWKDSVLFDEHKKPLAMISSGEDITEKKISEIALRESESRFKLLSRATNEGVAILNNKGIVIDANDQYAQLYGMTNAAEIVGVNCFSVIAPESKAIVRKRISNNIQGRYKCWCLKIDGTKFLMEVASRKVLYNGKEVRMSAAVDVTENHKFEKELKQSRENYKNLVDYSPDGVFIHVNGKIKFANPSALKIIEADSFEQMLNQSVLQFLPPEYHSLIASKMEKTKKGKIMPFYDIKAITLKGNIVDLEVKAMPIKYNEENAIQVVIHDTAIEKRLLKEQLRAQIAEEQKEKLEKEIAVRKKIQHELQKSEEKYRAIYNQAYIGIARTSLKGNFLQVNNYLSKMLGFTEEELCKKNVLDLTHPDDIQKTKDSIKQKLVNNTQKTIIEKRYIHKNGNIVFVEIISSVILDDAGVPMYFLSVIENITEKKENEKELITKSAKINAIFQNSSHLIYTVSRDGILTSYNENYRRVTEFAYGGSPKDGTRVFVSYSKQKDSSKKFLDQATLCHEVALSGISQHYEQKIVGKNGTTRWFDISLDPIVLPDGKIDEVSYIAFDITEKKENEIKINHSLQEKEVLLKEVHHRVKNNLQVISSILNLQSSSAKDPAILDLLKESQNRIKSMAYIHENLYRTTDFANVKFSEYMITLTENLVYSYATSKCPIQLNLEIENIFINLDLAIPCGLIVNELMTNALKYAFKGRASGEITIEVKQKEQKVLLAVIDNGVGFPETVDYRNTESLGLQLVITLTEQLGGTITKEVKNGTRFNIEFNQKTKKNE